MTAVQLLLKSMSDTFDIKINEEYWLALERKQLENTFNTGSQCEALCRRGFFKEAAEISRSVYIESLSKDPK